MLQRWYMVCAGGEGQQVRDLGPVFLSDISVRVMNHVWTGLYFLVATTHYSYWVSLTLMTGKQPRGLQEIWITSLYLAY